MRLLCFEFIISLKEKKNVYLSFWQICMPLELKYLLFLLIIYLSVYAASCVLVFEGVMYVFMFSV